MFPSMLSYIQNDEFWLKISTHVRAHIHTNTKLKATSFLAIEGVIPRWLLRSHDPKFWKFMLKSEGKNWEEQWEALPFRVADGRLGSFSFYLWLLHVCTWSCRSRVQWVCMQAADVAHVVDGRAVDRADMPNIIWKQYLTGWEGRGGVSVCALTGLTHFICQQNILKSGPTLWILKFNVIIQFGAEKKNSKSSSDIEMLFACHSLNNKILFPLYKCLRNHLKLSQFALQF